MLGLATINLCTKFEILMLTHYKDMNSDEKCKNLAGLGRSTNSAQHWRSKNGLEYRNSHFSRLIIGNHFSALCKNLVRFGSVTPEFKT